MQRWTNNILIVAGLLFARVSTAQPAAIRGLVHRLLPQQEGNFVFEQLTDPGGKDVFELRSAGGKIIISGNSANSIAVGLNYYLKYYCLVTVSWSGNEPLDVPAVLPPVPQPVRRQARCPNRFFLNYCTFGYTMPWWHWPDWERFIDWMALNGINAPLSITGEEGVWYRVWKKLGLTDTEIRSYFTGPAYLPWHRMANIDHWEGPLPQAWIDEQLALQQKIVRRERELGMRPVLPAFAGHVPLALKARYPGIKVTPLGKWAGFDSTYQSYFLDPFDPLFGVIQKAFLEEQNRLFGTSHLYGADPFNEVKPPSWEPSYLADVARQIYRSMTRTDTAAQWLQMGWIFYHQRKDWTNERIRAFLKAVPPGKMILLDYFCDNTEVWRLTDAFYGQSYIWSYLGNFGGNTFLKGDIAGIEGKLNRVFAEGGENLWGLGGTPEGFDENPFMYEYVLEKAWSQGPTDIDRWAAALAARRLGRPDTDAIEAWRLLFRKVYVRGDLEHQASLVCASPCLTGHGSWFTDNTIPYDNKDLLRAWGLLLKAGAGGTLGRLPATYRFDIVNIGRQVLGNYFSVLRDSFSCAYYRRDINGLYTYGAKMRRTLADLDRLLSAHPDFLLGKWLQDAASFGNGLPEKKYYNRDARRLLTTWGDQTNPDLVDYASRDWAGLIKTYYGWRWDLFIAAVTRSVRGHRDFDEKAFAGQIRGFEWNWTTGSEKYSAMPIGDCVRLSRELYAKYAPYIDPVRH